MCPSTTQMPIRKQRSLSARLVARRIAKQRAPQEPPKRAYVWRNRPEYMLTKEQIFAAADALLAEGIAPTCSETARRLGRWRNDNSVRLAMGDYWRDVWKRLSSAGVLRCQSPTS